MLRGERITNPHRNMEQSKNPYDNHPTCSHPPHLQQLPKVPTTTDSGHSLSQFTQPNRHSQKASPSEGRYRARAVIAGATSEPLTSHQLIHVDTNTSAINFFFDMFKMKQCV